MMSIDPRTYKPAVLMAIAVALSLTACEPMMLDDGRTKGVLSVSSDPQGARVFLDGEDTGRETPASFEVRPGSYSILLRRDGMQDWGPRSFTVSAGETVGVGAVLSPRPHPPGRPTDPRPADGATGVALNADLSWTSGSRSTSFDVYFGTDPSPDSDELRGNQAGTTFDPGPLSPATRYYWRVDAKNAAGTTAGPVWSFTTSAVKDVPEISIADARVTEGDSGATGNMVFAVRLSARASQEVTVRFATDEGTATAGSDFTALSGILTFTPGDTARSITVRVTGDDVDEQDETFTITLSNPRNATLGDATATGVIEDDDTALPPGRPTSPLPADGATGVALDADLRWTSGGRSTSYDVYFGTDPSPDRDEFRSSQASTTFDPGALSPATRYYWRIDAKNATHTTAGPVWSFTTTADDPRIGGTWTVVTSPLTDIRFTDIAWSGTRFAAIGNRVGGSGNRSAIVYSNDGITWTEATGFQRVLNGMTWTGNRFVAVGDQTAVQSDDGVNWRLTACGPCQPSYLSNAVLHGIAWNGRRYVAVGGIFADIRSSTDGYVWTDQVDLDSGFPESLLDVAWGSMRFVTVGLGGIGYSSDGIAWTAAVTLRRPYPSGWDRLWGVTSSGARFVAVGDNGTIVYSSDGIAWTVARSVPSSRRLRAVTWNGARFVAVGDNGAIVYSSDGIAWTAARSVPSSGTLTAVAGSGSRLVAVGENGLILRSP